MGEEVGKVVISVILSFIAFKFSGEGDRTTYHTMCEEPV